MTCWSVLLVAGTADAAARVRFSSHKSQLTDYGSVHPGSVDIQQFLVSWNETMGPPPRGWYRAKFQFDTNDNNNEVIKKSGDMGQTIRNFDFKELSKDHYCRFRNDDEGKNDECCNEEDQNCYTRAGCYCDTACFTVYGDCCTDHFVTCYDDLKLCLKKVKSATSAEDGSEPKVNLPGNHEKGGAKSRANLLMDAVSVSQPDNVEPDSCCGQEEYNSGKFCCKVVGGVRKLGNILKDECPDLTSTGEVKESVEEEEVDERLTSLIEYDEEEEEEF